MKGIAVITLAVLAALGGSAHAIRPDPGTPVIVDDVCDVEAIKRP